jgi:DNA-binding response OmpR family regulator
MYYNTFIISVHPSKPGLAKSLGSIIVIDDDIEIGRIFQLYLEEGGYFVKVHDDPINALSTFRAGYYDLSLLDIRMPHMNGFELFRRLRKIDIELKACFITVFEVYYESLKEFFPNLEVTCYIRKPVTKEELLRRVANALGR